MAASDSPLENLKNLRKFYQNRQRDLLSWFVLRAQSKNKQRSIDELASAGQIAQVKISNFDDTAFIRRFNHGVFSASTNKSSSKVGKCIDKGRNEA